MHLAKSLNRRKMSGRIGRAFLAACTSGWLTASAGSAQTSGSTATAVAGGALGLTSGATLAFIGSVVPCAQSRPGPECVRWSTIGGGGLGLTGGALLGASDSDALSEAAVGAGIGFLAGSALGLVLKTKAERFGWLDVATVGLFGGAIGAAPRGSAIGLVAGSAAGLAVWALVDSFETPDMIGAAAAGLALGGIAEWLIRGIDAGSSDPASLQVVLPVSVAF